jgi:hypothetical protein
MLQNPIVQTAILFAGAYYALNFLSRFWAPLGPIVTGASGLFAATIWILEHERRLAADLYRTNPVARPIIDLVCKATQRQVPLGGDEGPSPAEEGKGKSAEEQTRLLLETDEDFNDAAEQLKSAVRGHDVVVDAVVDHIRRNARMRARSDPHAAQAPLGMFLFIGSPGLGKRYLAEQLGWLLYKGGPMLVQDVAEEGASIRRVIEAVKAKPYHTIILENIDAATPQYLERLQAIAAGNALRDPTSGSVVSFRNCFFFLIAHKPGQPIADVKQTGYTVTTQVIAETVGLPVGLVNQINDYLPFLLPSPIEQAEVVHLLMAQECEKYNLRLGQVDPEIFAREVRAIGAAGGFAVAPGRIAKRLQQSIHEAIAREEETVDVVSQHREESEHEQPIENYRRREIESPTRKTRERG